MKEGYRTSAWTLTWVFALGLVGALLLADCTRRVQQISKPADTTAR